MRDYRLYMNYKHRDGQVFNDVFIGDYDNIIDAMDMLEAQKYIEIKKGMNNFNYGLEWLKGDYIELELQLGYEHLFSDYINWEHIKVNEFIQMQHIKNLHII